MIKIVIRKLQRVKPADYMLLVIKSSFTAIATDVIIIYNIVINTGYLSHQYL